MCGRFSLGLPYDEIQHLNGYNVHVGEWLNQDQFAPRHNIAPRSNAPVVRRRAPDGAREGEASNDTVIMQTMKWGLVPHWSKHEDSTLNTTNARCESLVEGGGMWASIKGKKRCAIPCEGYYEWLKKGKDRLPHFTKHKNGNLMLLAGLYDCVTLEGRSEPLWTFTIVTTDANSESSWLHDRQPVILSNDEALRTWLDTSSQSWNHKLTEIVKPFHDGSSPLECYQVPKEVGKVGTESPTFIQPIAQRKDGIQALFAKQKEAKTLSPVPIPLSSQSASKEKKRKRSVSPLNAKGDEKIAETKSKVQKLNTWEDDSDIEYVDQRKGVSKIDSDIEEIEPPKIFQPSSSKSTPKVTKSPKKNGKPKQRATIKNPKITTFFSKT